MNEVDKLLDKLGKIEALYAGAATDGERTAAGNARERIMAKLQQQERTDPPGEFRFRVDDPWSRKLLIALLRRYDILPYRYKGQRLTTVMARVPQSFVADTLWPEFSALDRTASARKTSDRRHHPARRLFRHVRGRGGRQRWREREGAGS